MRLAQRAVEAGEPCPALASAVSAMRNRWLSSRVNALSLLGAAQAHALDGNRTAARARLAVALPINGAMRSRPGGRDVGWALHHRLCACPRAPLPAAGRTGPGGPRLPPGSPQVARPAAPRRSERPHTAENDTATP